MSTIFIVNLIAAIFGTRDFSQIVIDSETEKDVQECLSVLSDEQREVLVSHLSQGLLGSDNIRPFSEEDRLIESKALRILRHPKHSKKLRDHFAMYYDYDLKLAKQMENGVEGYCFDILGNPAAWIIGKKDDALALRNNILEQLRIDQFLDRYESNNLSDTRKILDAVRNIMEDRRRFLKENNFSDVYEYNSRHFYADEKIHPVLVIIDAFDETTDDAEVKSLLKEISEDAYTYGISIMYASDSEKQIPERTENDYMVEFEVRSPGEIIYNKDYDNPFRI